MALVLHVAPHGPELNGVASDDSDGPPPLHDPESSDSEQTSAVTREEFQRLASSVRQLGLTQESRAFAVQYQLRAINATLVTLTDRLNALEGQTPIEIVDAYYGHATFPPEIDQID